MNKSIYKKDDIYLNHQGPIAPFLFDEQVARVFPDMISRSVPGYASIIEMIGIFARRYARSHTNCYDLGCSTGAATMALRHNITVPGVTVIAVDNAEAMTTRCREAVKRDNSSPSVSVLNDDIRTITIENASVVVLNFTLQFIDPQERDALLAKIFDGMVDGGILILSEKIRCADDEEERIIQGLHYDFKLHNGYSDLEISRKRQAIENVLIRETASQHQKRLASCGFISSSVWFRYLNFISIFAQKHHEAL